VETRLGQSVRRNGGCVVSDPAAEAAQRAHDESPNPIGSGPSHGEIRAAREALRLIRELHKPEVVRSPDDEQWTECTSCYGAHWPCATAKLIYTSEELGHE
jgi:hypothetical protein